VAIARADFGPVGAFDIRSVAVLAGGASFHGGTETGDCFNCGAVLVKGLPSTITIAPNILFQCNRCFAYSNFDQDREESTRRGLTVVPRTFSFISAAYRIPLSANELSLLGQISAAWGQLDEMMAVCVAKLEGVPIHVAARFMEKQTTGPRLNHLSKLVKTRCDFAIKRRWNDFYKKASPLIETRNHLTHGVWGYYRKEGLVTTVASKYSATASPIKSSELVPIASKVAGLTQEIQLITYMIVGRDAKPPTGLTPDQTIPFIFGSDVADTPETWSSLCDLPDGTPDQG
jgi:hypothetical protein